LVASEKRISNRVKVTRPVVILLSSGKKVHAYTSNFATNGMGILAHVPGEVNATLTFVMALPVKNVEKKVKVRGRIVHSHLRGDKYESGIEFVNVDDETTKIFADFVQELKNKRVC